MVWLAEAWVWSELASGQSAIYPEAPLMPYDGKESDMKERWPLLAAKILFTPEIKKFTIFDGGWRGSRCPCGPSVVPSVGATRKCLLAVAGRQG